MAFIRSIFIIIFNTTTRTNARVRTLNISLWLGQRIKSICQSTLRLLKQKYDVLLQVKNYIDEREWCLVFSFIFFQGRYNFRLKSLNHVLTDNHMTMLVCIFSKYITNCVFSDWNFVPWPHRTTKNYGQNTFDDCFCCLNINHNLSLLPL